MLLNLYSFAQETVKLNVIYEFSYVRDLDKKQMPYKDSMVLSLGKNSSRYSSVKLFNDNDKKAVEARRLEQEKMANFPSESIMTVMGGPMLTIGKYGALINEEIHKNFKEKLLYIDEKLGIKTYHAETGLPAINWSVLPDTKKIDNYNCQKAIGSFGGRIYEAWFATEIPYSDGPWKLCGLPGLILEARDTANEITFALKQISKNTEAEENIQSFLYSDFSIKTNIKDLEKAKAAFEKDPEGVMSAQAPNATVMVNNIDNPGEKVVLKIKKYNPMEL